MTLAKNYIWLSGAEVFSKLWTFAAFAFIARVAGPEGFGYVEFAVAVFLCASLVVDLGLSPYGAREIAKDPGRTNALVSEIVVMRFGLAVLAFGGMLVVAFFFNRTPIVTRLIIIYGMSLFAMPLMLQWVFQGHDLMRSVAMANVVRQCVFVVTVLVFLRNAEHLWLVAIAEVSGVVMCALFCLWVYRRRLGGRIQWRLSVSKKTLLEGLPIGLSQLFWAIKIFGGTMILGVIVADADIGDVGVFGGAVRILVAVHTFVWLYFFNLLPSFSRAWKQGPQLLSQLVSQSMHGVAWVCVLVGMAWFLLSRQVLILSYGEPFARGAVVLQLFCGVCILAALSGHFRFGLIAAGRQTPEMVTALMGAVVTIVFIPLGYWWIGLNGAGLGLLAAEVTVWLTAWWCGRSMLGLKSLSRFLIKPAIAVLITLGLLAIIPPLPHPVTALLGVVCLCVLAWVLDPLLRSRARGLLVSAGRKPEPSA